MDGAAGFHEEETLGKAYDARLMRRLIAYVGPYKGLAAAAVVLIVLSSLLQLVGPLATAVALDLYMQPDDGTRAAAGSGRSGEGARSVSAAAVGFEEILTSRGVELSPREGIAFVSGVYLASLLLTFFVLYVQSYLMQMMGQHIMYDLRKEVFGRFQRLPVSYFDRNPIGRLVTRVTTDVDALNELFTAGLVSIFGDVVLLVGIVGVLFWLDWRLAVVTFAILPLLLGLTLWFKVRARQSYRAVRVKIARINAFLQEHITGMEVLQLFNREERSFRKFSEINQDHRNANVRAIFYYAVYYPAVELITALGVGLIVWYGGLQVMAGVVSIGALIAFLQYAQRFYQPLADLSDKYNILQAAMAASERTFRVVDTPAGIESPEDAYRPRAQAGGGDAGRGDFEHADFDRAGLDRADFDRAGGAIAFEDVRFSYKAGEPVLRGISFQVEPGETLAIVGHTGAGKSTLANLLLRFYDVESGRVTVDDVDVRRWDLAALRRSIGLVLQDVFLFSGSVARNVRLDEAGIDDERVRWAAREAQALPFIEDLPGGFEATVRERGAGLSVGQKQLIAFARALAFDPEILILDEATSSIDTETEQLIQQALDRLLEGRTNLVIAHRLSTVQKADRILVLHKGAVREIGTHQELLAERGIYHRLYQLQFKDQEAG